MGMKTNQEGDDIVAEINMTPLIDIMLVLLIIFMVTSSVSLESGLDIDLPKTKSSTKSAEGDVVIISLTKSGELAVQGKVTPSDQLKEVISSALKDTKSDTVIFEGDKQATLGRAIEVMDIAKQAGAQKFAIAAEGN